MTGEIEQHGDKLRGSAAEYYGLKELLTPNSLFCSFSTALRMSVHKGGELMGRSDCNQSSWVIPLIGYGLYCLLFLSGFLLSLPILNIGGAFLFFVILLLGNYRKMFSFKKDATVLLAVSLIYISLLTTLASRGFDNSEVTSYLLKHILVLSLYILIFSYDYTPIHLNPRHKIFVGIILCLIAVSFISGAKFTENDESRISGVFSNPNNFALMVLSLLFFTDTQSNSWRRSCTYFLVFCLLIFSSTSGAIVSFTIGLTYKHLQAEKKAKAWFYIVVAALSIALAMSFGSVTELQFVQKIQNQSLIVFDNLWDLKHLQNVDYGQLSQQYGASGLSGIWRLSHWLHCIKLFFNDSVFTLFFGFGVGSSTEVAGKLPHNDFLRVLVEQGIVGFSLFAVLLLTIFRRLITEQKYIFLIFLLYSFTENVMDNLLFGVLFVLYLATSQKSYRNYQEQEI